MPCTPWLAAIEAQPIVKQLKQQHNRLSYKTISDLDFKTISN
ncbi:hypothetical protein [Piscirickettsia salmonis]|nr:hypothetical protein [Piscirickettsia salmonis]